MTHATSRRASGASRRTCRVDSPAGSRFDRLRGTSSRRPPRSRRAVRALAAPARLHPPRLAAADEAGEPFRAQLLARRRPRPRLGAVDPFLVAPAQLRRDRLAAQQRVDGLGDVAVDDDPLAVLDLDDRVERGRLLALEDALLRAPAAGLLVAEGHGLDPADEVRQGRVEHEVVEVVAVGRADELDAALGDRPRGLGLQLGPDLVDDDDLGHVVLDRLDHHLVLERRRADLHPAGLADGRVRDVAVAGDLVGRVDDHDPLAEVVGQDTRGLAEHRRLADARPAHDEDRLPGLDEVLDDLDRPEDGLADAAGEADDLAVAVADRRDAVERPLDARPVVVAEAADVVDDVSDVRLGHLPVEEGRPRCSGSAPPGDARGRGRPR